MRQPVTAATILSLMAGWTHAASFTPLGFLPNPGGGYESVARGVSADGSVVVGQSNNYAFRWTPTQGMISLWGSPGGSALGISADGNIVVGQNPNTTGGIDAFRWSLADGMTSLGVLPGGTDAVSYAYAASADGAVIVGRAVRSIFEGFRWTSATEMVGLGGLPWEFSPLTGSEAYAVSADGSIIAGYSASGSSGYPQAFRWTSGSGMVGLGFLPGGQISHARGMSSDGAVIVGEAQNSSLHDEAFRWTSQAGMVGLGFLPGGSRSLARGVSGDGTFVVGRSDGLDPYGNSAGLAFLWTAQGGMQNLLDVLVSTGVAGLSGWSFYEASAITPDGRWVIGWGENPQGLTEGFIVDLSPVPLPAAVWLLCSALGVLGWMRRKAIA